MQNVFSEGCLGLFENLLRVFECYSFETEYCLLVDKYLVVPVGISDPFACLATDTDLDCPFMFVGLIVHIVNTDLSLGK